MNTKNLKKHSNRRSLFLKSGFTFIALLLITVLVTGYYLMPAFGAAEEVLNGAGGLDTAEQVKEWSLVNTQGVSTWRFDNGNKYSGKGSGELESPTGSNIPFSSYVSYSFTTGKVPVSASLKLAYRKQYHAAQPKAGNWNVYAEIWKVGDDKPLEKIVIDNGTSNVNYKTFASEPFTSMKEMTQYELRLVHEGTTAQSASSRLNAWFDQVELSVEYDSTPPKIVSAKANTDTSIDLEFNEAINKDAAENLNNYSLDPELKISEAKLGENGKHVVLKTERQNKGTRYTVSASNILDISLNKAGAEQTDFTGIDTTPPAILQVKPAADNKVDIKFNEKIDKDSAVNKNNYQISPGLDITAAVLLDDGQTVQLVTDTQVLGREYTVKVNHVADLDHNTESTEINSAFTGIDTTPPGIAGVTVQDDSRIDVQFSETLDPEAASDKTNYTVSPELEIKRAELLPDQLTVRIETSPQTWQTKYTIGIKNVSDISGNAISNGAADFQGKDSTQPRISAIKTIDDSTVDVLFSEPVDALSSQLTDNYIISPQLQVQKAVLQEDARTLRLTTETQAYQTEYKLAIKDIRDLAGNLMDNTEMLFTGKDSKGPEIAGISAISSTEAVVRFNEKIAETEAQNKTNYKITDGLNNTELSIESAALQSDGVSVKLITAPQKGGINYILAVSGIKDLAGNTLDGEKRISFIGISPPDSANPKILSANATDNSTILIKFDATMDPVSSQVVANYIITPELPVTSALLQKDGVTVKLSTGVQASGELYNVTVQNVQDQYGHTVDEQSNTASFTGNSMLSTNPHGKYLDDTNQCGYCHVTHNSPGASLIRQPTEAELCYLCHDAGGQSEYDVASEFKAAEAPTGSHHNVADSSQQCSDCHNPHGTSQDEEGNTIVLTKLLQSSAETDVNGGNEFCFSCHKEAAGDIPAINPETYPADGVGHNDASFVIDGKTPFNPASGTDIRCLGCHEQHASSGSSLTGAGADEGGDKANVNSLCFKCHKEAAADKRYSGQTAYESNDNPHARTSSSNTNVSYPGVEGKAGQCVNCHDPHGTVYGTSKTKMKTLRGPYNDGKNLYTGSDFTLCFGCHNNSSKNSKYDIQSSYNATEGGHTIKSTGGALAPGSKMPCETCHTLHGQENNNKYMLKGELGSNLGDGRNECLACHEAGKVILGIDMTAPPTTVGGHQDSDKPCLSCHDSAHNPS